MRAGDNTNTGSRSGISLIEVLVALALLSISIAGASPVVDAAITRMEAAREESRARRLLNAFLVSGETGEGDIDAAYGLAGEWRAERQVIHDARAGSVPVRLEELRVEIEWQSGNQTRRLSVARRAIVPATR